MSFLKGESVFQIKYNLKNELFLVVMGFLELSCSWSYMAPYSLCAPAVQPFSHSALNSPQTWRGESDRRQRLGVFFGILSVEWQVSLTTAPHRHGSFRLTLTHPWFFVFIIVMLSENLKNSSLWKYSFRANLPITGVFSLRLTASAFFFLLCSCWDILLLLTAQTPTARLLPAAPTPSACWAPSRTTRPPAAAG